MASHARSDKEGAGPERHDRKAAGHSSSRKETERQEGRASPERVERQSERGQRAREESGRRRR